MLNFVTFNIYFGAVLLGSLFTIHMQIEGFTSIKHFWPMKTKKRQWHKIFDRKSVFPEMQKFWQVTWLRWINIKMISDVSESFPPWVFWSELGCAEIEKLLDPKFIARAQLRDTLLEKLSKFTNHNNFKLKILKIILIFLRLSFLGELKVWLGRLSLEMNNDFIEINMKFFRIQTPTFLTPLL